MSLLLHTSEEFGAQSVAMGGCAIVEDSGRDDEWMIVAACSPIRFPRVAHKNCWPQFAAVQDSDLSERSSKLDEPRHLKQQQMQNHPQQARSEVFLTYF
ncbi:hypothetical protein G3N59_00380 [Paraburkholderia sp. Ac-20340]|uniref:hypothetical protein n=1 Tax=Paraburkholderia sp. Ac-20340 TaxID=2703888 RepID=UPI0019816B9B|nr:hypothetical protein [Paraburkholderia sp. Ac-20340]MBN3851820.1 hypothetical protein [Paraburkholderia sp. Ac-20340]